MKKPNMRLVTQAWKRRRAYLAKAPNAYSPRNDQYYSDREVLADWAVFHLSESMESFLNRMADGEFEPRDKDHQ